MSVKIIETTAPVCFLFSSHPTPFLVAFLFPPIFGELHQHQSEDTHIHNTTKKVPHPPDFNKVLHPPDFHRPKCFHYQPWQPV